MKVNCGIIGLPNVGKSTLFKLLTNIAVKIENFPFCTIQPNIATVQIPDSRLYQLNNITKSHSIIHGIIEFIDIAGLIQGAAQGLGLGNEILHCIRTVKILCHVVRCFDNNTIFHIENNISPKRDINIINTELILFDISQCEKNIIFFKKNYKVANHNINQKISILEKCLTYLYDGIALRHIDFSKIEIAYIQQFNFLTFKPIIYIANVNENYINNNYFKELKTLSIHEQTSVIPFCGVVNVSKFKVVNQNNISNFIINNILSSLQLYTCFTVNVNMVRAWIYVVGTTALDISGYIHSDFKKGFIRVQIIKFNDFIENQGEFGAKKKGKVLYAGKKHIVEEGDILKFLFQS